MIAFRCPSCKHICDAPEGYEGGAGNCPQCGTRIAIPIRDPLRELRRQVSVYNHSSNTPYKYSSDEKNDLTRTIIFVMMFLTGFAIGFATGAALG